MKDENGNVYWDSGYGWGMSVAPHDKSIPPEVAAKCYCKVTLITESRQLICLDALEFYLLALTKKYHVGGRIVGSDEDARSQLQSICRKYGCGRFLLLQIRAWATLKRTGLFSRLIALASIYFCNRNDSQTKE